MNSAMRFGPFIFLLVGAGAGLCVGMRTHNDPPYQIHLDDSTPLVFSCSFMGALAGCGVRRFCSLYPRFVRPLGLASFALLGAVIVAPLGWIVGTGLANNRLPSVDVKEDVRHLPPLGLTTGAGVGCILGLTLGGVQVLLDRRRSSAVAGSGV